MIRLTPDKARWNSQLNDTFRRLERRMQGGMISVLKDTQHAIEAKVEETRVRPEALHRGHEGLAAAILAATYVARGFAQLVLGDAKILDQLAVYWHAIEVGSSHIVGRRVYGFTGPEGTFAPAGSRNRKEADTISAADAKAANIGRDQWGIVRNPIPPHHILRDVSSFLVERFRKEVDARFREAFEGIPYTRVIAQS